jgi:hypothetical protein
LIDLRLHLLEPVEVLAAADVDCQPAHFAGS